MRMQLFEELRVAMLHVERELGGERSQFWCLLAYTSNTQLRARAEEASRRKLQPNFAGRTTRLPFCHPGARCDARVCVCGWFFQRPPGGR